VWIPLLDYFVDDDGCFHYYKTRERQGRYNTNLMNNFQTKNCELTMWGGGGNSSVPMSAYIWDLYWCHECISSIYTDT
jgi:hypothetical protein